MRKVLWRTAFGMSSSVKKSRAESELGLYAEGINHARLSWSRQPQNRFRATPSYQSSLGPTIASVAAHPRAPVEKPSCCMVTNTSTGYVDCPHFFCKLQLLLINLIEIQEAVWVAMAARHRRLHLRLLYPALSAVGSGGAKQIGKSDRELSIRRFDWSA